MKAHSYKLSEILREIREGNYVVPRFQRKFDWRRPDSCLLIDSIARNYPTGPLLLLPAEALELAHTSLDYTGARQMETLYNGAYHILDGQQRLTSIARAFIEDGSYYYYFDLAAILQGLDETDSEQSWVIARIKAKAYSKDISLLPCPDALKASVANAKVMAYIEATFPQETVDEREVKASALSEVLETVRNYQVIVHQMEKNIKIEAICRIFKTINTTGRKLDTFDLIVAKNYTPTFDLRQRVDDLCQTYPTLAGVPNESLLHAIYYYRGIAEKRTLALTKDALLSTPGRVWDTHLERAAQAFTTLEKWLFKHKLQWGVRSDVMPLALLTVFVACEMAYPGVLEQQTVSIRMKRWLLSRLWPISTYNKGDSAPDIVMLKSFFETAALHADHPPALPELSIGVITGADVSNAQHTSRKYHVMMAILVSSLTHDIFGGTISESSHLEDHHILPKAVCDSQGLKEKDRDSLANRILVTRTTNNTMVTSSLPAYYYAKSQSQLGHPEAKRLFEASLIPEEFISATSNYTDSESFTRMLDHRAELIAARLNDYFNIRPVVLELVPELALAA